MFHTSIPYNYIDLDMSKGDPGAEWYASINPNGRMPAIVHNKEDGTSVAIFESAACLLYIAHEFDKEHSISYPVGTITRAVLGLEEWLQLNNNLQGLD